MSGESSGMNVEVLETWPTLIDPSFVGQISDERLRVANRDGVVDLVENVWGIVRVLGKHTATQAHRYLTHQVGGRSTVGGE